jgi:replicative superfamily II helicase
MAILGQKTLDRFGNTFLVQKTKNTLIFCHTRTNGKQSIKKKTKTKTNIREMNKARSSTRNHHAHVSKPVKTVR